MSVQRATGFLWDVVRSTPWTFWLAVLIALVLFRSWYFSAGILTFGDLYAPHARSVVPDSFHLWTYSQQLGYSSFVDFWFRVAFGSLSRAGISEAFSERIGYFFYFTPLLLVIGFYLLGTLLTGDRVAGGVASLAAILSPDFLVRSIGGHASAIAPIGLTPIALLASKQFLTKGSLQWLGILGVSIFIAAASDIRWTLPTLLIMAAMAASVRFTRRYFLRCALACSLIFTATLFPNLPWILPALNGSFSWPGPQASHYDTSWLARLSIANLNDALAGWNPTFANGFDHGVFILGHLPPYGYCYVGLVIISAAIIIARRNWTGVALILCYVAFVILFKGVQWPFGEVYIWLFHHVAFFDLYREPLKFGFALSTCASLMIAYGVASLRSTPWLRAAGPIIASATVVFLALHAFFIRGGTLISRSPPPYAAAAQHFFDNDRTFGRVLWLPEASRWIAGSPAHPISYGLAIADTDWAPFADPPARQADPLLITRLPHFADLLRWYGFHYVVVDRSIYDDATYRRPSLSTQALLEELKSLRALIHEAAFGPFVVFRTRRASNASLWSAGSATEILGNPANLGIAASAGVLDNAGNMWFRRITHANLPHRRALDLGDGDSPGGSAGTVQVRGATILSQGKQYGDTIIDQDVTGHHQNIAIERFAKPSLGVLASYASKTIVPISHGVKRASFIVYVPSVRLYDEPMLSIVSSYRGTATLQFVFRQPSGALLTVNGPFYRNTVPRTEMAVRPFIFEQLVKRSSPLSWDGRYDSLRLRAIQLSVKSNGILPFLPVRFLIRAQRRDGYAIQRLVRYNSSGLGCNRCRHRSLGKLQQYDVDFTPRERVNKSWMGQTVAIRGSTGALTAVVDSDHDGALSGFTVDGTPFSLQKRSIVSISPAPDFVLMRLPVGRTKPIGVLIIDARWSRSALKFALVTNGHGHKLQATRIIPLNGNASACCIGTWKVDLATAVPEGINGIDTIGLLVGSGGKLHRAKIEIDDIAIANGSLSGKNAGAYVALSNDHVFAPAALPTTPVSLRIDNVPIRGRSHQHPMTPNNVNTFRDFSGYRWLFWSERFDPQWRLYDAAGKPIGKHFIALGSINGWFLPSTLRGAYRIENAGERLASVGFFLAIGGLVSFLGLVLIRRQI